MAQNNEVKSSNLHEFFKPKEVFLSAAEDFDQVSTNSGVVYTTAVVPESTSAPSGAGASPTGTGASDPGGGSGFDDELDVLVTGTGTAIIYEGQNVKDVIADYVRVKCSTRFHPSVTSGSATLENAGSGSPAWAGTTRIANGTFSIAAGDFIDGDNLMRMKVESSAPGSASDVSYSNIEKIKIVKKAHQQIANTYLVDNDDTEGILSHAHFNSAIYFAGQVNTGVYRLYKMTTSESVSQVSTVRIDFGGGSDSFWQTIVFDGALYFVGEEGGSNNVYKLTTSDSVEKVTNFTGSQVKNLEWRPIVFNSKLWFVAEAAAGKKVFSLNTSGVLTRETNLNSGGSDFGSEVSWVPIVFDSNLFFVGNNGSGTRLFRIDTSNTLSRVSNLTASVDSWSPIIFNSKLYCVIDQRLCSIDSSFSITAVTPIEYIILPSTYLVKKMIVFNNFLYFSLIAGDRRVLAKLSTSNVITRIIQENTYRTANFEFHSPVENGGRLYFVGRPFDGNKVFSITTSDVVRQVTNIAEDLASDVLGDRLLVVDGAIYFTSGPFGLFDAKKNKFTKARLFKITASHTLELSSRTNSLSDVGDSRDDIGLTPFLFNSNIYCFMRGKFGAMKLFRL